MSATEFARELFVVGKPAPSALRILDERPIDAANRDRLLDEAFGDNRYLKTSERLRERRRPADGLALVAKDGDALVGTLRLWNVDAGGAEALFLGPLAVAASHRRHGLGARLMRASIARAANRRHRAIILVGDEPYYRRFGFRADLTTRLELPGHVQRERFLGLELTPGALGEAEGLVTPTGRLAAQSLRTPRIRKAA